MKDANPKFGPSALTHAAALDRSVFLRQARRFIFLILVLWLPVTGQGDSYDATLDRRFPEPNAGASAVGSPAEAHLDDIESVLKAEQQKKEQGPPVPVREPISHVTLALLTASLLAAGFTFSRIAKVLDDRSKIRVVLTEEDAEEVLREKLITEQPTLVSFFNELRYGLGTMDLEGAPAVSGNASSKVDRASQLQEFFELAPTRIRTLRTQFSKIGRAPRNAVRAELLREFFRQVDVLNEKSKMPELRPAWLMTCGLEGLLQQLSMTASDISPSVLRTVAGAVDLLEALCVPSLDPQLATRKPIRLLAVDDNAVCLSAISLALKKVYRAPDLAAESVLGLGLAEEEQYDVIFLDIEMPGMDGFELCSKIRETELNRTTPVVFVTSHSDFSSRAKSTLVGGQDLIAKPYLSFEITVKALTLALRGRLGDDAASSHPAEKETADCAVD